MSLKKPIRTKFYSKNSEIVDISTWKNTSGSAMDLYRRYGWEGAMAWGNLIHNELNFHGPGVEEGDVFLDIGANIGMSSIRAESCGASKIYAIEPDVDIFEALNKNKNDNWTIENVGISNKEETIQVSKWPNNSEYRDCPAITLETFLKKHRIEKIDYMKVDIEGAEKTAFNDTPIKTWNKIRKVFIEMHDFSSEETQNFIVMFLDKLNFPSHRILLGQHQNFLWLWK
jgi:FkbM family methyltransferase